MTGAQREALAGSCLLEGVPEEQWDEGVAQARRYEQGHVLCRRGEHGTCLWVIVRGTVDVMSGGERIVRRQPPDVVGEMAVLRDRGTRSADLVVADTTTELLEISRNAIETHPSAARIWQNVANLLSAKLRQATHEREILKGELGEQHRLVRRWVGEDAFSEHLLAPDEFVGVHHQRKAVIWFSDVVGFSTMAMDILPGRIGQLVQDFLSPQVNAIRDAGGHVDKFMGDGIMAYWTVGSGEETACCGNALGAALESLRHVREIPCGGGHLDVRVGLHIGEVLAGNFGTADRVQYTLIGREVNKAARLEQVRSGAVKDGGPPAAIRVSEEFFTYLSAEQQRLLPNRCVAECKEMRDLVVMSGDGSEEERK